MSGAWPAISEVSMFHAKTCPIHVCCCCIYIPRMHAQCSAAMLHNKDVSGGDRREDKGGEECTVWPTTSLSSVYSSQGIPELTDQLNACVSNHS